MTHQDTKTAKGSGYVGDAWMDFEQVANRYEQDNLMLDIEMGLARELLPSPLGQRVLDVGCGTGRWSRWALDRGARRVLQLDRAQAMLEQARSKRPSDDHVAAVRADLNALALVDSCCNAILAALCLGYTGRLDESLQEIARCLRPGGWVYVSDVHPDSQKLNWKRTYTLPNGTLTEPAYCAHSLQDYQEGFARHGLHIRAWRECFINESVQPYFEDAGRLDHYYRWHGAPLLLLILAYK